MPDLNITARSVVHFSALRCVGRSGHDRGRRQGGAGPACPHHQAGLAVRASQLQLARRLL